MRTFASWPAWYYRHPDGEAHLCNEKQDLENLLLTGEDWRDEPVPADATAADAPPAKALSPEPDIRPPGMPPQAFLYAQNAGAVGILVDGINDFEKLVWLARDEHQNPDHRGGRKGVLESIGNRMVELVISAPLSSSTGDEVDLPDAPPDAPEADPSEGPGGEQE